MRSDKVWQVAKGILVLHLFLAVVAWFSLPQQIPTHFGASGKADAWDSSSVVLWFSLVATSVGLSAMIYYLSSPKFSSAWNIGEKERFLKLTPEQQKPVLELMRIFGAASAICVNVVFLTLHLGMYLTANGHTKGLPWWINMVIFGAPFCLIVGIVPWDRAVRQEILKASGEAA